MGNVGSTAVLISTIAIVTQLKETPKDTSVVAKLPPPFVPTLREMFQNWPYRNYIYIRFTEKIAGALVGATFFYWIKFHLHIENALQTLAIMHLISAVCALLWMPVVSKLASRLGKKETMAIGTFIMAIVLLGLYCTPASFIRATKLYFCTLQRCSCSRAANALVQARTRICVRSRPCVMFI